MRRWRLASSQIGLQYVPDEQVAEHFPLSVSDEFDIPTLMSALDALNATGYFRSIWPIDQQQMSSQFGYVRSTCLLHVLAADAVNVRLVSFNASNEKTAQQKSWCRYRVFWSVSIENN